MLDTQRGLGLGDQELLRRPGRPERPPCAPATATCARSSTTASSPPSSSTRCIAHQPAGDLGPAGQPAHQRPGHGGPARRPRAGAGDLPRQRRRRLHRRPRRRHRALRPGPQRQRPAGLHPGLRRHRTSARRTTPATGTGQHRRPLHPAAGQRSRRCAGAQNAPHPSGHGRRDVVRAARARTRTADGPMAQTVSPSYLTGYDPTSGLALGAGGQPLLLRPTGGQAQALRRRTRGRGCCSAR